MARSIFDKMSASISPEERSILLKKINKSMDFDSISEETVYNVNASKEKTKNSIEHEIAALGFLKRFSLKVKSLLVGKNEEIVYTDLKMTELRKLINKKASWVTNFETRTMTKVFAEVIYDLYVKILPLCPVFDDFWKQGDTFNNVLSELIKEYIDGTVTSIDDILTDEETEAILMEKEAQNEIKKEVLRRFNRHTNNINGNAFTEIEDEIMPLYYLRAIISFPYMKFLREFGFDSQGMKNSYLFKNASVFACIELFEKFYYAIYMILKIGKPVKINYRIAKYFYRDSENENEDEDEDNSDESDKEPTPLNVVANDEKNLGNSDKESETNVEEAKLKWFYSAMNDVYSECYSINKRIPFMELIRYYRKDLQYKLVFYVPKLKLKEFYLANLKIKVLEGINDKYIRGYNLLIEKNIKKFFKNKTMQTFTHLKIYDNFDYNKIGIVFFDHIKSMELLYNYFFHYYNEETRFVLDSVVKNVLSYDKIASSTMVMQLSIIDDIYIKIIEFDNSLNTESEDGKLFYRLRYSINDITYFKMYKLFISKKNKVSADIIERYLDAFDIIIRSYTNLLKSSTFEIKNALSEMYTISDKSCSLKEFLSKAVDNMKYFKELMIHLNNMEGKR